jgi:hypothetical protein
MDESRYKEILESFDRLGDYAIKISHSTVGITTDDSRILYADIIFTKLICHAISLRKISPDLNSETTPELWDLSSACAIARALVESFEALAYISLNNITLDERDFRIKLWELHDFHRRIKMLEQLKSKNSELNIMKNSADLLQEAILKHNFFSNCTDDVKSDIKRKINKKEAPAFYLSQKARNMQSGINHEYHDTVTMALSQFVHTFPMAIHQLMSFRARCPESLHACSMPIQYSLAYLAKAISGMTEIFPNKISSPSVETASDLGIWLNIAENGVSNIELN